MDWKVSWVAMECKNFGSPFKQTLSCWHCGQISDPYVRVVWFLFDCEILWWFVCSSNVQCPSPSRAWLRGDVVADGRCWKKFTLKLNFVFVHTRAKTVSFTAWANTKHRLSIHTGSLFKHLVFRIWKLSERNQKQLFLSWVSFTSSNQDPSI